MTVSAPAMPLTTIAASWMISCRWPDAVVTPKRLGKAVGLARNVWVMAFTTVDPSELVMGGGAPADETDVGIGRYEAQE